MSLQSPFLKAAIVAALCFGINLYFAWDLLAGVMSREQQGNLVGGVFAVHLMAFLVTGLLGKFTLKNGGWLRTVLVYFVFWLVFWFMSGAGERSDELRKEAMQSLGTLQRLGEDLEGEEARAHERFTQVALDARSVGNEFAVAFESAMEDWVLEYSRLGNSGEFDRQRRVLDDYHLGAKRYQEAYLGMEESVRRILGELGPDNQFAQGALEGFMDTKHEKDLLMVPYLEAHVAYSQDMIDMLDLLEQNPESWSWDGEQLSIDSDPVWERYQEVVASMTEHENAINELTSQLQ